MTGLLDRPATDRPAAATAGPAPSLVRTPTTSPTTSLVPIPTTSPAPSLVRSRTTSPAPSPVRTPTTSPAPSPVPTPVPAAAAAAGVLLRPACPADREPVGRFLAGLTLDSAYRRFFTGIGSPSSTLVRRLVEVDQDRRTALLAVIGDEVVGLADTALDADGRTVELGVVVADRWQRQGIGPWLCAAALAPAVARGATSLRVHSLPDNSRVARLLRRRWPAAAPRRDDDALLWELPL